MKGPFLVDLRVIDSLDTFSLIYRKLVAPSESRYCANIVCLYLFINFFNKEH